MAAEINITSERELIHFPWREIWEFRELLFFLAWRDVKIRYKQTALGVTWVLIQPLLTMALLSTVFGRFAGLPSDGFPYSVFTLTALVPWQLFSHALSLSSTSLLADHNLITKVYFPRIIMPLASVLSSLVDFGISLVILLAMVLYFGIPLNWRILTLPLLTILALITAVAVGVGLSALSVKYRDVRYVLPFLSQLWMYATPVAYSSSIIPQTWKWIYSLNPMTGVVEGFRWALLGASSLNPGFFCVSVLVVLLILGGSIIYFHRIEDEFADVI